MILFDFDGVILDSVDEVLVTTYALLTNKLTATLDLIPSSYRQLFRNNRFHAQPASDLPVLGEWCLQQPSQNSAHILTREAYCALLAKSSTSAAERREQFFNTRAKIIKAYRSEWLTLNHPYQPLWSALATRPAESLLILTNKNRSAVLEICSHYGLQLIPENIFSGDNGTTKTDNYNHIKKRGGSEFLFVDDSVHNLKELKNDFPNDDALQLALASWGYTSDADKAEAARSGFKVLTQDQLIKLLPG